MRLVLVQTTLSSLMASASRLAECLATNIREKPSMALTGALRSWDTE